MITSYEVGTIFKIVDRASPVLSEMARMMYRLEESTELTKKNLQAMGRLTLGNLNRGMASLVEKAAFMDRAFARTFKSVEAGTDSATRHTKLLADEWRDVAQAARLASINIASTSRRSGTAAWRGPWGVAPGPSGRATARHGGLFGVSGRNHAHLPGGTAISVHGYGMAGQAALAAAGVIGYSVYEEAQIEDIAARALMTGQIKLGKNMRGVDAFKRIRDVIRKNSAATGFGPREVGEAILQTERQFGGLDFNKRLKLENTILPFAAIEARMKETRLPESFKAMVGLAHMTGTYDPKKLPALMRQFSYASMVTPVPINQFERALSYSMPILTSGMKMSPGAVMFLTAMAESAGITNTKSGTWIRSFFERLMPASGIIATRSAPKHNAALRSMGLLDASKHPTWEVKGVGGQVDWMQSVIKLSQMMNAALSKMDNSTRLSTLHQVFGERGGGFGALMNLPQFIAQFPVIARKMANWQGGRGGLLEYMAGSPVQQSRTAWADLQNVLIDIGQVALPPLLAMLQSFDRQLIWLDKHWPRPGRSFGVPKPGTLGDALGKGMGEGVAWGAGAGALVGALGGPTAPVTVPGGAILGGAIGAFGGGLYEGGRWMFGLSSPASSQRKAITTTPMGSAGTALGPVLGRFAVPDDGALPSGARPRSYSGPAGFFHRTSFETPSYGPFGGGPGFAAGANRGAIRIPSAAAPSGIIGHVKRSQEAGARRMMHDLMARGWSKEAAAVAAGNASVESGFNASNHSGDGGTSWGLMQWHLGRRSRMVEFAQSHGKNWTDWDSQIAFLDKEWRERFGNDSVKSHDLNRLKWMGKRYEGYSTSSFGTRNALTDRFMRLPSETAESPAVHPPPPVHHTETPVNLHLDGRIVARSTMKHMVQMGNGPARGPRLPDYTAVRPINV